MQSKYFFYFMVEVKDVSKNTNKINVLNLISGGKEIKQPKREKNMVLQDPCQKVYNILRQWLLGI